MFSDGDDLAFEGGTIMIRFMSFLPYSYVAYYGSGLFSNVLDKPELLRAPYNPNIGPGQGIAAIMV
jgi:hypothetical protein